MHVGTVKETKLEEFRVALTPDGVAEITQAGHEVIVDFFEGDPDQPIVVGRTESGEAFALRDICPHRLVPLSAGKMKDTDGEPTVECPYHGWVFHTDGRHAGAPYPKRYADEFLAGDELVHLDLEGHLLVGPDRGG